MLITPHVLTAAALAKHSSSFTKNVLIIFFIGLLSHYALDAVPHWDVIVGRREYLQTGIFYGSNTYLQVVLDFALVALILGFLIKRKRFSPELVKLVLIGALGGVTPDLLDVVPFWNDLTGQIPILAEQQTVHEHAHVKASFQNQLPSHTGVWTQIAVCILAVLALL